MPLITDPDHLSQGGVTAVSDAVFQSASGATVQIASAGGNLPAITAGDYMEVRDHSTAGNNGLYLVTGSPSTSLIALTKQALTGSVVNPANASSEAIRTLGTDADEKNLHLDTVNRRFTYLNGFGSTTVLDNEGVDGQAEYSRFKDLWRTDADLPKIPFPAEAITDERIEYINGWRPVDEAESTISTTNPSNTRQLKRSCGWLERDTDGFIIDLYFGWISLGAIESGDNAYYFFSSQSTATDAVFDGPVNEGVRAVERVDLSGAGTISITGTDTFNRSSGSFVTDGFLVGDYLFLQNAEDTANNGQHLITAVSATAITVSSTLTNNADDGQVIAAIDRRPLVFATRVREFGKTYEQSTTTAIGVTALINQVYRFPLDQRPDAVVTDLAASETSGNVATLLSNITGGATAPYNDMAIGYFNSAQTRTGFNALGGDTPSPGHTQFGVIIEGDAGNDAGGPASAEQIYAFTQAMLQLATNINDPNGDITGEAGITIVGKLAEPLLSLASTGNTLSTLAQTSNPGGSGGTGVAVDNFDSNDTNRLAFVDNDGDDRSFPFVAAGTINFNVFLSTDPNASYWVYFTNDDAGDNTGRDWGTNDAILVNDNSGTPISGNVPQQAGGSSIAFDFDFDGNVQRGAASAATNVPITIVASGRDTGQHVTATGTITRTTGLNFSVTAAQERNYDNP